MGKRARSRNIAWIVITLTACSHSGARLSRFPASAQAVPAPSAPAGAALESLKAAAKSFWDIVQNDKIPVSVRKDSLDQFLRTVEQISLRAADEAPKFLRAFATDPGQAVEDLQVQGLDRSAVGAVSPKLLTALQEHLKKDPKWIDQVGSQAIFASTVIKLALQVESDLLLKAAPRFAQAQGSTGRRLVEVWNDPDVKAELKADIGYLKKELAAAATFISVFKEAQKDGAVSESSLVRLLQAVTDAGVFFIKSAQTLSNSNMLPPEIQSAFARFQDGLDPIAPEEIARILGEKWGVNGEWRKSFAKLDTAATPFKTATIGQVYEATLAGSAAGGGADVDVIVKVGKPGVRESLARNRKTVRPFLDIFSAMAPGRARFIKGVSRFVDGLADSFEGEIDLRVEAGNLERFRYLLSDHSEVVIPRVFREFTTDSTLVMERVQGENLDRLLSRGTFSDGTAISAKIRERWLKNASLSVLFQFFVLGEMHADMHPGNVLGLKSGQIGLIDFGAVTDIRMFRGMIFSGLVATLTGSEDHLIRFLKQSGDLPADQEPKAREIIRDYLKTRDIKTKALPLALFSPASWGNFKKLGQGFPMNRFIGECDFVPDLAKAQVLRAMIPMLGTMNKLIRKPDGQVSLRLVFGLLATTAPKLVWKATRYHTRTSLDALADRHPGLRERPARRESPPARGRVR